MMTFWKQEEKNLVPLDAPEKNCWVNVVEPTEAELERLRDEFRVPAYFIKGAMDVDERSRSEVDSPWMLLILRIPVYDAKADAPFITILLGVME